MNAGQEPFDNPPDEGVPDVAEPDGKELGAVDYSGHEEPVMDTKIEGVRRKHEARLLGIDGVCGVGVGTNEIGDDVIVVYVRDQQVQRAIPATVDGVPVKAEVSGEFEAY